MINFKDIILVSGYGGVARMTGILLGFSGTPGLPVSWVVAIAMVCRDGPCLLMKLNLFV